MKLITNFFFLLLSFMFILLSLSCGKSVNKNYFIGRWSLYNKSDYEVMIKAEQPFNIGFNEHFLYEEINYLVSYKYPGIRHYSYKIKELEDNKIKLILLYMDDTVNLKYKFEIDSIKFRKFIKVVHNFIPRSSPENIREDIDYFINNSEGCSKLKYSEIVPLIYFPNTNMYSDHSIELSDIGISREFNKELIIEIINDSTMTIDDGIHSSPFPKWVKVKDTFR